MQHVLIGAVGYRVYVRRVIRSRLELVFCVILESREESIISAISFDGLDRCTILTSDP